MKVRSIVSLVSGFVITVVLALGSDGLLRLLAPQAFSSSGAVRGHGWLALMLAYTACSVVVGCLIAARLAPSHPLGHAVVLGVIGLVFTIAATLATWGTAPSWYHLLAMVQVMPSAWLGGWLGSSKKSPILPVNSTP